MNDSQNTVATAGITEVEPRFTEKDTPFESLRDLLPQAAAIFAVFPERGEDGKMTGGAVEVALDRNQVFNLGDQLDIVLTMVSGLLSTAYSDIKASVEAHPERFAGMSSDTDEVVDRLFFSFVERNLELAGLYDNFFAVMLGRTLGMFNNRPSATQVVEDHDLGDEDDAPESLRISEAG